MSKNKTQSLRLACGLILLFPFASLHALELVEKKLHLYGKIHLSVDSSDRDDPGVNNDGTSISSNSSRLGLKGEIPAGAHTLIYQYEQGANLDSGGGQLVTRNSYGGIKSKFGKLIIGHHDTPFHTVGSKWGLFSDTVGDRRTILGASYVDGNQLNERARNALLYALENQTFRLHLMHAIDAEVDSAATGNVDNNDISVTSFGLHYNANGLWCAFTHEGWTGHSKAGDSSAMRLALKYKLSMAKLGFIYEAIDSDTHAQWKRNAMGVNADIKLGNDSLRIQYVMAESADGTTDTGGSSMALGYFHKLDKSSQVYLAYNTTDNDANAAFQGVDGGHGDEVKTVAGGAPSSFSAGLVFKF